MFESLSQRFSSVFDKLTGRGTLNENDIAAAMRDIRRALIEADVALPVVRSFTEKAAHRARSREITRAVAPGRLIIKIVHDLLVETLGTSSEFALDTAPPSVVMMIGLQGAGKTTTTAKLALHCRDKLKIKILMASLDNRRPAAQEQLAILGEKIDVDCLPIKPDQAPEAIARRALTTASLRGYDLVLLDTAGRMHSDQALMDELTEITAIAKPHHSILVADALTGQDAARSAQAFNDHLDISGIILTRCDGDGRGGAALSMRTLIDAPILFLGMGEDSADLEPFYPERLARRILGMGDIASLVEKITAAQDAEKNRLIADKMRKGLFDFDDLAEQLKQLGNLGGGIMDMIPGLGKLKSKFAAPPEIDEKTIKHQLAMLSSMTGKERKNPKLLNGSRRKRIASGSGTSVQKINQLLKMHRQMADLMKGKGLGGMMAKLGGNSNFAGAPGLGAGLSDFGSGLLEQAPADLAGGDAGAQSLINAPISTKPKRKKRPPRQKKRR